MQTEGLPLSYIRKNSKKVQKQSEQTQTLQIYKVLSSAVKSMSRALQERDFGSLVQAGHNLRIIEEIYDQMTAEDMKNEENLSLLKLGRTLSKIADLLICAKTEDPIFRNITDRIVPYFDLLLEDICTSRKQICFPKTQKGPSIKLLPAIKEDIVLIMTTSNSKKTIISGIKLHQMIEDMTSALSTSRHLLNFR